MEPQPQFAERLRLERKSNVVQKACGAPKDKGKVLTLRILGANAALFPERVFDRFDDHAETVEVELDTLDNMLAKEDVDSVGFISLDIEGYEVDALRGIDLAKYAPTLILIEDHLFDLKKHRFLKRAGYKWVRRTQNNNWYVPRNEPFQLTFLDRLLLLRKMYVGMPFRRLKKWIRSSSSD